MAMDFLIDMGKRISVRRKALGITQEKLAEQMNVSVQMISNLEHGKKAVRPENLAAACKALDISADYILTGESSLRDMDRISEKVSLLSPHNIELTERIIDILEKDEQKW